MKRIKGIVKVRTEIKGIENRTKNNKENPWIKAGSSEKNSKTNKPLVGIK